MQNISPSICLITCLVLVATNGMVGTVASQDKVADHLNHSVGKLEDIYCASATIHDDVCYTQCHNTTTFIRDCDNYNDPCDEVTTYFDFCNATDCRNTTRHIHACYNKNFADADIHCNSCYNTACVRNRTTHIHACYSNNIPDVNYFTIACAAASTYVMELFVLFQMRLVLTVPSVFFDVIVRTFLFELIASSILL